MKILTHQQFACNGHMISELGQTRISVHLEHNWYHLKHSNILCAGQVWEVFKTHEEMVTQFRKLRILQKANYIMKNYEVKT